jgi:hypothetical protein
MKEYWQPARYLDYGVKCATGTPKAEFLAGSLQDLLVGVTSEQNQ